MKFSRTVIERMAVELPDEVWSSELLEEKLAPVYCRLKLPQGRLELMTGIRERRFWSRPTLPSQASAMAGKKAMHAAGTRPEDIDLLIHSAVCRDRLEPSTAAYVHGLLGLTQRTMIFDVSNACLGFLNAMVVAANMIESGQIRRALICSGENGRPLVENTIAKLNSDETLTRNSIKPYFANFTIGAGAVAAVLAREDLAPAGSPKLIGGIVATDSDANRLCEGDTSGNALAMQTDSEKLLEAGIDLAARAWADFKAETGWDENVPAHVITHQVGVRHSSALFAKLGLDPAKDRRSFDRLGNVGSVSLPATLALYAEAGTFKSGEKAALLGIGSGLSSLMLGVEF
ncbi:MAG: 3-oxoacyl-ACP synthase III [Opitutales bacterium]|nr:3-oxoacyl-ACP synthase III [Opitutales bacterium]